MFTDPGKDGGTETLPGVLKGAVSPKWLSSCQTLSRAQHIHYFI